MPAKVHLVVDDLQKNRQIMPDDDITDFSLGAPFHAAIHRYFPGTIWNAAAAVTVGNTAAEQSLLSTTGVGTTLLPANALSVGSMFRVRTRGFISCANNQQSRLKFKVDGVNIIDSLGTLPSNLSNFYIESCFDMVCYSTGTSGTIMGSGRTLIQITQGITNVQMRPLVMTSPVTVNTTIPLQLDQTYQWSTKSADNSVTIVQAHIRFLNCGV